MTIETASFGKIYSGDETGITISGTTISVKQNAVFTQTATTGVGYTFERDLAAGSTDSVILKIHNKNASDDVGLIHLLNESTGRLAYLNQNGVLAASQFGLHVYSNAVQVNSQLLYFQQFNASSSSNCVAIQHRGTGTACYLDHNGDGTVLVIDGVSTVKAPLKMTSMAENPTGAHVIGEYATVTGVLKICTAAGTPGTWTVVGTQT